MSESNVDDNIEPRSALDSSSAADSLLPSVTQIDWQNNLASNQESLGADVNTNSRNLQADRQHPRRGWSVFGSTGAQLDSVTGADSRQNQPSSTGNVLRSRERSTLAASQSRVANRNDPLPPSVPTSTTLPPPDFVMVGGPEGRPSSSDESQSLK